MNKKDVIENVKYIAFGIIAAYLLNFGLGVVLRSDLPIVAVVSCSMEHDITNRCDNPPKPKPHICGNYFEEKKHLNFDEYWEICGSWYEDNSKITKEEFLKYSIRDGFLMGDVLVVKGVQKDQLKVGDVIVYSIRGQSVPIVHRIIKIEGDKIITKGDHNSVSDPWKPEKIHGKAVFVIPFLGWPKLALNCLLNSPTRFLPCMGF